MAEKEKKNIFQRLMQARIDFAKKNIQPSGYNPHLNFDYLELKDIVPVANKVMMDNGIMLNISFEEEKCVGRVVSLDDTDEVILFFIPYPDPHGDAERLKLNEVAMVGSQVTYLRRYMLMLVLDICINDEVDADGDESPVVKPEVKSTPNKTTQTKTAPKAKAKETKEEPKAEKPVAKPKAATASKKTPASPVKRAEIKKELTNADGKADELQINTLKAITMRWVNTCPADKEKATNLLVSTNGFANCTRSEADELIDRINKTIKEAEEKKE